MYVLKSNYLFHLDYSDLICCFPFIINIKVVGWIFIKTLLTIGCLTLPNVSSVPLGCSWNAGVFSGEFSVLPLIDGL